MTSKNQYTVVDNQIRFGKPIIKGTRIAVEDFLNWLQAGMSDNEIIKDFPQLNNEQIKACLNYSHIK